MYSDNNELSASVPRECKRDFEAEIKRARKNLSVKQCMKSALEDLKNHCGTPNGEARIHFFALYGDMCFEVAKLNQNIEHLIKEQEKIE